MSRKKPEKRKTNIEIIDEVMSISRYGYLAQLFVLQAVTKYAEAVAQSEPAAVGNGLIPGEAWIGVAREIKDKLDRAYADA